MRFVKGPWPGAPQRAAGRRHTPLSSRRDGTLTGPPRRTVRTSRDGAVLMVRAAPGYLPVGVLSGGIARVGSTTGNHTRTVEGPRFAHEW